MATSLFEELAPRIMRDLLRDVPAWSFEDAAACVGNAAHECNGFRSLQEIKPVVKGSRGGWGWFQWTGPRRRQFEKYATGAKLAFDSYEANYGFLLYELRNTEKAAISKTASAKTLNDKVVAFELAFERAGVKHYPSRQQWAARALKLYQLLETEAALTYRAPVLIPQVAVVSTPAPSPKQGFFKRLLAAIKKNHKVT